MHVEGRKRILLVTQEAQTSRSVAIALEAGKAYATNGLCRTLAEMATSLELKPSPVALVDIDQRPEAMLQELAPIAARFRNTSFVVLASDMRGDLVLSAMRAGARNFVVKKTLLTDLAEVLRGLVLGGAEEPSGQGGIVTILSASGGCGATTIAIGLADALARAVGETATLVDLDVSLGAMGLYLGLENPYGLADVLNHGGGIDTHLLLSTAVGHSDRLRVLLSPATANFASPAPLELRNLERLLEICRQVGPFTIIDAPRASMDLACRLARQSLLTMIVLQQNVKDIRTARAMLLGLADRGVPWTTLLPVVNRWSKRTPMVSFQDAQKALAVSSVARVVNDFKSALRSMNYGQPVGHAAPGSKLSRNLVELADQVIRVRDQLTTAAGRPS